MNVSAEFVAQQLGMQVLRRPFKMVHSAGKAHVRFGKKIELFILVAELHTHADAAVQPGRTPVIPPGKIVGHLRESGCKEIEDTDARGSKSVHGLEMSSGMNVANEGNVN